MSVLRSHNNKTRGGLGRVCATGMYRSIEHLKFPKFQTGIFVEWKAPLMILEMIFLLPCKVFSKFRWPFFCLWYSRLFLNGIFV